MSRKTKRKNRNYGILENGQVVRIDTILEGQNRYLGAKHYKLAETKHAEPDLDFTVAHRKELAAQLEQAEKNARAAGLKR